MVICIEEYEPVKKDSGNIKHKNIFKVIQHSSNI
jgi:hypothetical protein